MTGSNETLGGAALVEALQLGERQAHGPLAVFPLRLREDAGGPRLRHAAPGDRSAAGQSSPR